LVYFETINWSTVYLEFLDALLPTLTKDHYAASLSGGIHTELPGSHTARTPGPRDSTMCGYARELNFLMGFSQTN